MFYIIFFFFNGRFAHSLFFNEQCEHIDQVVHQNKQCERIAQVDHQKWANERIARFLSKSLTRSFFAKKQAICSENRWATMSESLKLLTKNERIARFWANCSFFEPITHSLIYSQKTSNLLRKFMSEFPALKILYNKVFSVTNYIYMYLGGLYNS